MIFSSTLSSNVDATMLNDVRRAFSQSPFRLHSVGYEKIVEEYLKIFVERTMTPENRQKPFINQPRVF